MITLNEIIEIINQYSKDDIRIKHRSGDHPFYRGLYLIMARKHARTSDNMLAKHLGMSAAMVRYWGRTIENWFFTRKDLKWIYEKVDREIAEQADQHISIELLDNQAQEVLNKM